MTTDLETQIRDAIEARLSPPSYWCARKACSNTSRTSIEGGACSNCQAQYTWDEIMLANVATKLGFGPGIFFSDLETMLGKPLRDLESMDADALAALWDSAGLSKAARPLSPSERRKIKESNSLHLAESRRRQQERHLAAAEKSLAVAQKVFADAQESAGWSPEVPTTTKAVR